MRINLFDLIFPPSCAACDRLGRYLCINHLNDLTWNYHPPLDHWIYSAVEYRDSAQDLVKLVKYGRCYRYARTIAQLIVLRFPDFWRRQGKPIFLPVPLHPKKRKWRGFNQAELVARELARCWRAEYDPSLLRRTVYAKAQAGQDRQQRAAIQHSFQATRPLYHTKICLVDDVVTTGSTLNACRQALLAQGATKVVALTFAREQ